MATQPAGSTVALRRTSARSALVRTGRRVTLRVARAILVAMLLVVTLAVAALAAALSAIVVILAAPWWIFRLWLGPARDRSPSSTGALLDARLGRDDDMALAAPSGI